MYVRRSAVAGAAGVIVDIGLARGMLVHRYASHMSLGLRPLFCMQLPSVEVPSEQGAYIDAVLRPRPVHEGVPS